MSHPWVYRVKLTGDKMTLRVEVTDVRTTGGAIEITGEVTQVSGAFAPISYITDIAGAAEDVPGRYFVDVEAVPTPDHPFMPDDDVTVFVRVSKPWVTVLGPGTDDGQSEVNVASGLIWGKYKKDAQISVPASGTRLMIASPVWTYSVKLTDGKMTLSVEITPFKTAEGAIEITGEVTQVSGAFAPISYIADRANAIEGDPSDPDQAGKLFVDVEAVPTPDHPFMPDDDVTVFVRPAKAWVTVLGAGTDEPGPATAGPVWGVYKTDAQLSVPTGS
jgi:hypothetical protein